MVFTLTDLGLRERRLEGEEYISIVDELMEALHARWPKAIIQVYFFLELCFLLNAVFFLYEHFFT